MQKGPQIFPEVKPSIMKYTNDKSQYYLLIFLKLYFIYFSVTTADCSKCKITLDAVLVTWPFTAAAVS